MPKIPLLGQESISNRVEKADLITSGNPVYQQMANIGGELADIGAEMRRKELDAEAFDYVQKGMRSMIQMDDELNSIAKETRAIDPSGKGYAQKATDYIRRRQEEYFTNAPSERAKRMAQQSLGGRFIDKERQVGMEEIQYGQKYRFQKMYDESLTDVDMFAKKGDFKDAHEYIKNWEAKSQAMILEAEPQDVDDILRQKRAVQNGIANAHISRLIDAGDYNSANNLMDGKVEGGADVTKHLTPEQFNSLRNKIDTKRKKDLLDKGQKDFVDLSKLSKLTQTSTEPMDLRTQQEAVKSLQNLYANPEVDKDKVDDVATDLSASIGYSKILQKIRDTGNVPTEEEIRTSAKETFVNLPTSFVGAKVREDLYTDMIQHNLAKLEAQKKKDSLGYLSSVAPDSVKNMMNIPLDFTSRPSEEVKALMTQSQEDLDKQRAKYGISYKDMKYGNPKHVNILRQTADLVDSGQSDPASLQIAINSTSELYGARTQKVLKEAKLDHLMYLPYMTSDSGQVEAIKAMSPEVVELTKTKLKAQGRDTDFYRNVLSTLMESDVIRSKSLELEGNTFAEASDDISNMTKMLESVAHQYAANTGADADKAAKYALSKLNINNPSQQNNKGLVTLETNNVPLVIDSEVNPDTEVAGEYLSAGFGTFDYKRNFVKEFNIRDDRGFGEDILNNSIKDSGFWVRNANGSSASLVYKNREGRIETVMTNEGKPLTVDLNNFSKISPEYKRFTELRKENIPFGTASTKGMKTFGSTKKIDPMFKLTGFEGKVK